MGKRPSVSAEKAEKACLRNRHVNKARLKAQSQPKEDPGILEVPAADKACLQQEAMCSSWMNRRCSTELGGGGGIGVKLGSPQGSGMGHRGTMYSAVFKSVLCSFSRNDCRASREAGHDIVVVQKY